MKTIRLRLLAHAWFEQPRAYCRQASSPSLIVIFVLVGFLSLAITVASGSEAWARPETRFVGSTYRPNGSSADNWKVRSSSINRGPTFTERNQTADSTKHLGALASSIELRKSGLFAWTILRLDEESTGALRLILVGCSGGFILVVGVWLLLESKSAHRARFEEQPQKLMSHVAIPVSNCLQDLASSQGKRRVEAIETSQSENRSPAALANQAQNDDAMRASEQLYRTTFDRAGVGIAHGELDGRWIRVNRKFCEILGYSEDELLNLTFQAITHPDDLPRTMENANRLRAGEIESFTIEKRYRRGDDTVLWANVTVSLARDSTGQPSHSIVVVENISRRKHAEAEIYSLNVELEGRVASRTAELTRVVGELRAHEQRTRRIVDSAQDAFVAMDGQGLIIDWNPKAILTFGWSRSEALGRPLHELIIPEPWREAHVRGLRELLETDHSRVLSRRMEQPAIRRRGEQFLVELTLSAIHQDGEIFFGAFLRDITERKQVEERLRWQTTAMQAAANGIIITDAEGTIQWVNEAFSRLTGYSAAEVAGQNPRLLKSGYHDEAFYGQMWRRILAGHVWHDELVNRRKDGRLYHEDMTIAPVTDEDGRITHFIAIKQDVSDRKRAEEQIKNSLAEKEILLQEIHHRVKNNLQIISSILNLQSRYVEDAHSRGLFEECQSRVQSLALVHEKLYQAQNLATIELGEHISELATMLVRSYAHGASGIQLEIYTDAVVVDMDTAIPVSLILNELITNAQKHAFSADRAGTLTVSLRSTEMGQAWLSVRDDGPGLPAEFEHEKCRSLGMKMIYSLARQIRGELTVSQNSGTDFAVRFPVKQNRLCSRNCGWKGSGMLGHLPQSSASLGSKAAALLRLTCRGGLGLAVGGEGGVEERASG